LLLSELQDEIDRRIGGSAKHSRPHVNAVVELCVRVWIEQCVKEESPYILEFLKYQVKYRYIGELKKRYGNPLAMWLLSILITTIINALLRWLIEDKKTHHNELLRMQGTLSEEFHIPDIDEEAMAHATTPEDTGYPKLHEPAHAHQLDAALGVQASCCDGARCHKPAKQASEPTNVIPGDAALLIVTNDDALRNPRPYVERRQTIYLAGPMSRGDTQAHVDRAVAVYGHLIARGYSVICPQLSHYAEQKHGIKMSHCDWLAMDLELVKRCDFVLRLYGESEGADQEMQCAYENNIHAASEVKLATDLEHLAHIMDMFIQGMRLWEQEQAGLRPPTRSQFSEARDNLDKQPEPASEPVSEPASEPVSEPSESPEIDEAAGVSRFKTGAVRSSDVAHYAFELLSPIGLRRAAEAASEGEIKYSAHNWERGFPISDLVRHVLGHIFSYLAGDRDEDHLGHATWGLMACCHSEELWPHLNTNLRRAGCIPPNVSDEAAREWGKPAKRWEKPVA
jgi:hypothetical protein